MTEKRQSYNQQFREETVKYIQRSPKSVADIAQELNIPEGTLGIWVGKYRKLEDELAITDIKASETESKIKEQDAVIQKQVMQIEDLIEENAILKKAMHYFSKDRK